MCVSQWGSCYWWIAIAVILLSLPSVSVANGAGTENCLRRRIVHFGSIDSIKTATLAQKLPKKVTLIARTKRPVEVEEEGAPASNKLWPPWPFNLIGKKANSEASDDGYPSTGTLFWAYLRQRSRVGVRQIQQRKYIGSVSTDMSIWIANCHLSHICPMSRSRQ